MSLPHRQFCFLQATEVNAASPRYVEVGARSAVSCRCRLRDNFTGDTHLAFMNYLIAVLPSRDRAEAAHNALQDASTRRTSILGQGYQSADDFGFIDPKNTAENRINKLAYWLIPFGFVAGYAFNQLSGIEIFSVLNDVGNHIIGGVLGAIAGGIGAVMTGGTVGATGAGDALAYRNRLNAGKYIVVAEGDAEELRRATTILSQFEPENLQGYQEQG